MNNSLSKAHFVNPIRLSHQDTPRLPYRYLILLALAYIVPGLIWRGLWRQEASSFGVMLTMANGSLRDWLLPNVAGAYIVDDGPLPYWIGALFIKVFRSVMNPFHAAQLATACQDGLAMLFLWRAVLHLGTHPLLQPQRLAFGGEPSPVDYGRMLADSSVLLFIATYGVAAHTHDTSNGATQLMTALLWLYGASSALTTPTSARWTWALGLAGIGLSVPFTLFIGFVLITMAILFFTHWREHSLQAAPLVLLIGLGLPLLWVFNSQMHAEYARLWLQQQHFAPIGSGTVRFFLRNILLFSWPLWPLAGICLWRWRTQWRNPMMILGVWLISVPTLHLMITGQRFSATLLFFIPGLLVLATFGLATLNRGRANIIDWFSLFTFSILAAVIWMMWETSWQGYPQVLYHNIMKLAPGFEPHFHWLPFGFACLASAAWAILLSWRIRYEPRALWKSVVLSSGGLVMVWVLLATLAMPWLDYTRSYERAGKSLADNLPTQSTCVRAHELPTYARAAMYYYAKVSFVPEQAAFAHVHCPYVLTTNGALGLTAEQLTKNENNPGEATRINLLNRHWQAVWHGERTSERRNTLVLLRED